MFGLFRRKRAPEGPVELRAQITIDRPPEDIYALLDWSDPRNAKRATGNRVEQIGSDPDTFQLIMPFMDDLTFTFRVETAEKPHTYAFDCVIEPRPGLLEHSREIYSLRAESEGRCEVSLTLVASLVENLSLREYSTEIAMMAAAAQSDLQKLKLQAEHGAEVAMAVQENTIL